MMTSIRAASVSHRENHSPLPSPISATGVFQKVVYLPNSQSLCHYHNKVHGGLQSTIIDEAMAEACSPAVTAFIHPTFWTPLPPGSLILVEVDITKIEGRKRWVVGRIMSLGYGQDRQRTLFTDAVGLFVIEREVWQRMSGTEEARQGQTEVNASFETMREAEMPLLQEDTGSTAMVEAV